MKKTTTNGVRLSLKKMRHFLIKKNAIMNWNILDKCILMLVLGSLIHLSWIVWKVYILLNPEVWIWVSIELIHRQMMFNSISLGLFIALIYLCRRWAKRPKIEQIMPYLAVGTLVISICRDGYLVGVLSPTTMVSYVCLVMVGLVLFSRTIVYVALIPATLFLLGCGVLSYFQHISYGPLFTLQGIAVYENGFWLLSMMYFITPMLITCLILFEILLSQWRYREHLIRRLSQIDPLTNLSNRRSINRYLNEFNINQEECYAVVLVDLDHFKSINDRYGHGKGDEALILVGEALSLHLRESDVVGRFGGEEFILLLKNTNQQQAIYVAERCLETIQQIDLRSEHNDAIKITASFGIAMSHPSLGPQQLLSQADQALYAAKAAGRNCIVCYEDTISMKASNAY